MSLSAGTAVKSAHPEELKTIGDHIRKVRFECNLSLKQTAKIMSVDDESIVNWEKRHKEPSIKSMAKITSFLGYIPFDDKDDQSLGRRLKRYRIKQGISKKRLAKQLGVDPTTLNRIEENRRGLNLRTYKIIGKLLDRRP